MIFDENISRTEREPWLKRAACLGVDPDAVMFFPVRQPSVIARYRRPPEAIRSYCSVCPVRRECGAYGQKIPLVEGVWGGVEYRRGKPVP